MRIRNRTRLSRAESAFASKASRYFFCVSDAGVLEQSIEGSVRRNQIARAFFADTRNPLDVVDRVAHQREHVDHLLRSDTEFFFHARRVVPRAFIPRVEHPDPRLIVDELKKILVTSHDGDRTAFGGGPHGQRADHVVGFEACEGQHLNAECLARLVHERDLLGQVRWHRRAVRLVVVAHLRSKCRA